MVGGDDISNVLWRGGVVGGDDLGDDFSSSCFMSTATLGKSSDFMLQGRGVCPKAAVGFCAETGATFLARGVITTF